MWHENTGARLRTGGVALFSSAVRLALVEL